MLHGCVCVRRCFLFATLIDPALRVRQLGTAPSPRRLPSALPRRPLPSRRVFRRASLGVPGLCDVKPV